ncbi:type II toxin-antitoxin system VapB family antitoxin [Phenylobacterium sp.]|uniref:type II toxin-antitoxin system VapB family antitoxin n=1 Tax=Phenylobacterium sp. TaxID=1871053 RepID=UPI00286B46C4|nr:type II toxin-antitoxin system VapB family antitoxin [Phenylobacterium sp.]
MPFHVRDPETNTLVRELARRKGIGLTEAVKQTVGEELKREASSPGLLERLRDLQDEIASRPSTGLKADKAFFDWLSGEEDV